MSNLRWILLFAGFAILLLLYFSGRPRKVRRSQQGRNDTNGPLNSSLDPAGALPGMEAGAGRPHAELGVEPGASMGHGYGQSRGPSRGIGADPLMDAPVTGAGHAAPGPHHEVIEEFDPADFDVSDFERPGGGAVPGPAAYSGAAHSARDYAPEYASEYASEYAPQNTPEYTQEYAEQAYAAESPEVQYANEGYGQKYPQAVPDLPVQAVPSGKTLGGKTLGGKLDALSARLTGRKKPSGTAGQTQGADRAEEKVILLHVVAPEGQIIDGQHLLQVFEQRRYHFGERNIFHSLHQNQIVFSIAKMVEPGSFDVDEISSFETPGLVLILQLPGPVAADVAFEVLVSEAQELADALGCRVLDSKRSTLSRQTTQHLRESVGNYMHRQKYLSKAMS